MNKPTMKELIEKINKSKASSELDLSMEEDLSIAIMNLISLEEHFFFTAEKQKRMNTLISLIKQEKSESSY